jgi:hypothetical protein
LEEKKTDSEQMSTEEIPQKQGFLDGDTAAGLLLFVSMGVSIPVMMIANKKPSSAIESTLVNIFLVILVAVMFLGPPVIKNYYNTKDKGKGAFFQAIRDADKEFLRESRKLPLKTLKLAFFCILLLVVGFILFRIFGAIAAAPPWAIVMFLLLYFRRK